MSYTLEAVELRRIAMPLRSAAKRKAEQRARDAAVFEAVRARLAAGEELHPGDLPAT